MNVRLAASDLSAGGMTRAYSLALALGARGHDCEIVGRAYREREVYPAPPHGVRVERRRLWAGPRPRADLLLALKPLLPSYGAALGERAWRGTPLVLDIDDWEPLALGAAGHLDAQRASLRQRVAGLVRSARSLTDPNHSLYSRWTWRLVQRADAVIVSTPELQRRFGGMWVPHARDTVRFDPLRFDADECRRRLGLSQYCVLLFAGTPRAHKGLEDLLQALEKLGRPELRLVIAGGRRTDYAELLYRRWSRWIVRLPRAGLDDMPSVVAAGHIAVIPQRDEPAARSQFPMKLTDAMAMAKPILTTRVGDLPELVGAGAFVVAPSSPDALAAAIDWILAHPEEARRRGEAARRRCVERYSLPAVGAILDRVLERVAPAERRSPA
jgi:glycosyltransferase involved in cell wall biosynthesis